MLIGLFFNALILCFALWLFARHEARMEFHYLVLVSLGINICALLITLWLGAVLSEIIPAPYIALISIGIICIAGVWILYKFCYVSILQAVKVFVLFLVVRVLLTLGMASMVGTAVRETAEAVKKETPFPLKQEVQKRAEYAKERAAQAREMAEQMRARQEKLRAKARKELELIKTPAPQIDAGTPKAGLQKEKRNIDKQESAPAIPMVTIYTKAGDTIETRIVDKTDKTLWYEVPGGKAGISLKRVSKVLNQDGSISKYSPQENEKE